MGMGFYFVLLVFGYVWFKIGVFVNVFYSKLLILIDYFKLIFKGIWLFIYKDLS